MNSYVRLHFIRGKNESKSISISKAIILHLVFNPFNADQSVTRGSAKSASSQATSHLPYVLIIPTVTTRCLKSIQQILWSLIRHLHTICYHFMSEFMFILCQSSWNYQYGSVLRHFNFKSAFVL